MSQQEGKDTVNLSRRRFIQHSSLALAGAAASEFPFARAVHAAGPETEIKIGLIGCGGRGTGAVLDALGAASRAIYPSTGYHTEDVVQAPTLQRRDIKVVALADLFEDRLTRCAGQLAKLGITIPKEQCFTGFDAYKQLLAVPEINYAILTTPPHFRPMHLKAAIEAGKHVFMEKPVAVDVPGVKMVMDAGRLATQKGLGIAAGTQRRHAKSYQETIKRLQDGAIGEIVYGRCYWDGGEIWVIKREPGWSDMEWQLRNWNYFTWLSGDHYVEQHVHNLDVMNWVLGTHPIRAVAAVGGRQVAHRPGMRPHLRPFRRGVRVPQRRSHVQPGPPDQRQRQSCGRGRGGHPRHQRLLQVYQAQKRRRMAFPWPRPQRLSPGTRRPDRQHPGRQADQRRPGRGGKHHDRDHRPRGSL